MSALINIFAVALALFLLRSWIFPKDALAPAKAPASPQQSGGAKTKKKKAKKKGGSGSHRGEEEEDLDEIVRELEGEPPKAKVKSPPSERAAHSEKPAKGAEKGVGGADAKAASGGKKAKQEAPVSAPVAAESRHQQQAEQVEKAKVKEVKGAPMPVDSDSDEEHPRGDVLVLKAPAARGMTVRDFAHVPAEDGWERVSTNKAVKPRSEKPQAASIHHYQPVQPTAPKEEDLTAKQKANKRKAEKQKMVKEVERELQEERLRAHRRTQEKEFVWKPPPPKVIPKTNKWETNTLSMDSPAAGGGDRGTSGEGKAEEATELFWE